MPGFKQYKSKPITRRAYQVTSTDNITMTDDKSTFNITISGDVITFKAYEVIFPGDYIVHLADDDIYHCRQAVFHERNIVG